MESGRGCEICYYWSQSIGTSKARNLALQIARHEYLVIIDDDMFVAKDWLTNLVKGLIEGGRKCAASGKVLPAQISAGRFTPSTRMDDKPAQYEGRVGKDVLWSNNMVLHRSVLAEVGFFDERMGPGTQFPAGEDNDYGFRVLEAGYQILYLPSAVVYHRDWRLQKDYIRLRWKYGVGRGAYYAKYFSLSDQYQFRRMLQDIRKHLFSSFNKNQRDGLITYGDLVLAVGILIGACRWLVHYGWAHQ
jgi:GT2 family glycosyltransferase